MMTPIPPYPPTPQYPHTYEIIYFKIRCNHCVCYCYYLKRHVMPCRFQPRLQTYQKNAYRNFVNILNNVTNYCLLYIVEHNYCTYYFIVVALIIYSIYCVFSFCVNICRTN